MKSNKLFKTSIVGILSIFTIGYSNASNTLDMNNLKCGDYQIYSNTTIGDLNKNCNVVKEITISKQNSRNLPSKYWDGQKQLYEVHFTKSKNDKKVIYCDFNTSESPQKLLGCR